MENHHRTEKAKLIARNTELEASVKPLNDKIAALQKQLDSTQAKENSSGSVIGELRTTIDALKTAHASLQTTHTAMIAANASLTAQNTSLTQQVAEQCARVDTLQAEHNAELESLRVKQIAEGERIRAEAMAEANRLKLENERLGASNAALARDLSRLLTALKSKLADTEKLSKENVRLSTDLERKTQSLQDALSALGTVTEDSKLKDQKSKDAAKFSFWDKLVNSRYEDELKKSSLALDERLKQQNKAIDEREQMIGALRVQLMSAQRRADELSHRLRARSTTGSSLFAPEFTLPYAAYKPIAAGSKTNSPGPVASAGGGGGGVDSSPLRPSGSGLNTTDPSNGDAALNNTTLEVKQTEAILSQASGVLSAVGKSSCFCGVVFYCDDVKTDRALCGGVV